MVVVEPRPSDRVDHSEREKDGVGTGQVGTRGEGGASGRTSEVGCRFREET